MVGTGRMGMFVQKIRGVTKGLPVTMEMDLTLMRYFIKKAGYPVGEKLKPLFKVEWEFESTQEKGGRVFKTRPLFFLVNGRERSGIKKSGGS